MLQAYVTPPLLALVVAVHLANLAACLAIIFCKPSRSIGWQHIAPSWTHWGAYFGGWAITALMTWMWLFVGSARYDAEAQMWYAYLLLIGFGGLGAACGFQIAYMRRASLRWRGMAIRRREGRKDGIYDIAQFDSLRPNWDGSLSLRFRNGKSVRLDIYARNAEDLIHTVYPRSKHHEYWFWRPSPPAGPPRRWWQLRATRIDAAEHFCTIVLPIVEGYGRAETILEFESREQSGSKSHCLAKYMAFRHASAAVLALNRFAEIVANYPPANLKRFKCDPNGVRQWMGSLHEESRCLDDIADALTAARSENKRPASVYREGRSLTVDEGRGAGIYGEDDYGGERIWAVVEAERRPLTALVAPLADAWIQELGLSSSETENVPRPTARKNILAIAFAALLIAPIIVFARHFIDQLDAPVISELAPSRPGTLPDDPFDELSAIARGQIQARLLLEKKDFQGLNALAAQLRTGDARTPSGLNKLAIFYYGLLEYAGYQTVTPGKPPETIPNEQKWQSMFDLFQEWIDQAPSPAAYIGMAKLRTEYAFKWRGPGYANTVDPSHLPKFHENLQIAFELLVQHPEAQIDPEWFVEMATFARNGLLSPNDAKLLYAEATEKHRLYFPVYTAIAESLHPRWGGSWAAVEDFANLAVEQTRDKEGLSVYSRIYQILNCLCDEMVGNKRDWVKMKQGFEDILSRYPVQWNLNRYAFYACTVHDKETTRALIGKITQPRADAWGGDARLYFSCKTWALGT